MDGLNYYAFGSIVPVRRYETFMLEKLIPAPTEGFLGDYSHDLVYVDETPKRYILAPNRIDWYIICGG
jgi:hypothetical protein